MRYTELLVERTLGGFAVKTLNIQNQGDDIDEAGAPAIHRIGLTVTDPNHPMVSKRRETIQKTVRVTSTDREAAINSAIAHYRRKGYKVHDHHYIGIVDNEIKEFAPPGGDDGNDGFSDETLKRMAAQWWQGDEDPRIEKTLMAAGWEIGQDEGYDNGGVFVVRAGDVNGDSYMSWPAEELEQGMAEGAELKKVKRAYNQAAKDANADQVGAGKKIDTMKKSLRQKDVAKQGVAEGKKPDSYHIVNKDGKPATLASYADRASAEKDRDAKHPGAEVKQLGPRGKVKNVSEGATGAKPGWMLKQDPELAKKVKDSKRGHEALKKWAGKPVPKDKAVDEAIKLDAPQKKWSRDDMQDYLTRIKTGTKTKQDRFKPIIHGSNVKAITKDDGGEEWDLDDLARQITTRPRTILGTNAKMAKSKKEGAITYDLTLPALSGIVVDEETGDFVEITTCPGAGECQLYCYARKGGYVMFPASSMSAAQALNFLVNHPSEYMEMFDREVKKAKELADKNGIKLLVRVHDAGDFFSKEYYDLVMGVKGNNPGVKFYFYTKMGDIASADQPDDVIGQFSPGAKSREVKTVQFARDAGKHVKDAVTLPKDMFRDLFVTDAKGKYVKDDAGRTQIKSEADWNQFKQKLAAAYDLDPDTIITYDQMVKIPEGPKPKWNVVVFPAGHGDLGASRLDVSKQFLMFH